MKQTTITKVFDRIVANERTVNEPTKSVYIDLIIKLFLASAVLGLVYVTKLLLRG